MLKQKIKYVDYNENEREEEFLFNLTQAEITEMEISTVGGLSGKIQRIIAAQDGAEIMRFLKEIVFKAYGEKSPDGKHFVKSEELSIAFSQTEAYNQMFMRLVTDSNAAAAFVEGIIPHKAELPVQK